MVSVNYLDNRRQKVGVGDCLSTERDVTGGVPQMSLLRPLHFLVYFNDLPEITEQSSCFGHADDNKVIADNSAELDNELANLIQ